MTVWGKIGIAAGVLFGLKLIHDSKKLSDALKATKDVKSKNFVAGQVLPAPVGTSVSGAVNTPESKIADSNPYTDYAPGYMGGAL